LVKDILFSEILDFTLGILDCHIILGISLRVGLSAISFTLLRRQKDTPLSLMQFPFSWEQCFV